jgi:hypothetical protein
MADAAEKRTNSRRMKELAAEDEVGREGLVSRVFCILLEEIEEMLRFNSHRSWIRGCGFPHLLFSMAGVSFNHRSVLQVVSFSRPK